MRWESGVMRREGGWISGVWCCVISVVLCFNEFQHHCCITGGECICNQLFLLFLTSD